MAWDDSLNSKKWSNTKKNVHKLEDINIIISAIKITHKTQKEWKSKPKMGDYICNTYNWQWVSDIKMTFYELKKAILNVGKKFEPALNKIREPND